MYELKPLTCDPAALDGLSEKLIASHYENNYGGAVKRLNQIQAMGKPKAAVPVGSCSPTRREADAV